MKKICILMAAAALVVLTSCSSKKPVVQTASYFNQTTECLGKQLDGTQLLKVYAKGVDRADAVREAKKKAIEEVLSRVLPLAIQSAALIPLSMHPMPVRNTRTISTSSLRTAATSRSMLTRLTKTCATVSRVLARKHGVS